ncbi:hypothetical protein [Bacteroides sp.]|uniref:hypothetical protein n=1 Tax=Bacteroides sp. TaxID=29523 RepID=UPI0026179F42|nr:hypothetical protein [Bacteroides sp.]MDD3039573.1 hypothetical protein [Bacteroides sp.]
MAKAIDWEDLAGVLTTVAAKTCAAVAYEYSIGGAKEIAEAWANQIIEILYNPTQFGIPEKAQAEETLYIESGTLLSSLAIEVNTFTESNKVRSAIAITVDDGAIEPRSKESVATVLAYISFGVDSGTVNIPERPVFQRALEEIGIARVVKLAYSDVRQKMQQGVVAKGFEESTIRKRVARGGAAMTAAEELTRYSKAQRDPHIIGRFTVDGDNVSFAWT